MSLIYLCGFMGCGKTTVGKTLAQIMGYDFIDIDSYIQFKYGMDIPQIFEEKGEDYFREIETQSLIEINGENKIISTGGGALTFKNNADITNKKGTVVYIQTTFKECYSRIKNDKSRPIASTKNYSQLAELYKEREPLYIASSKYIVSGNDSVNNIVNKIISILPKI